jgi:23S rRNA pseudouridine955/2504/2580 synthase
VAGNWPHDDEITLKDRLAKRETGAFELIVTDENGKSARSRVSALARRNNNTLLKIILETGRTHQIRVQLASRSYPVIGDVKYGGPEYKEGAPVPASARGPPRVQLEKGNRDFTFPPSRGYFICGFR